ncbi:response regulator transcription factor [Phenylobacterium sp.]|jgi:two-component system OmpR family response regulator|uniref:response regulator transcription factor n=1 Tax=Phenylobacterium sp. TaxID=1871053 RepID=UPI002F927BA4
MTAAANVTTPQGPRAAVVFGPSVIRRDGPQKVLWLEPQEAAAQPGVQMLRRQGLEVTWMADPVEAAEALDAGGFDLVILETALGGADGLALCRRIAEGARLPVLVYAAQAETLDRVAALEFGADDVLGKDAHPLELMARVRALLRRGERGGFGEAAGRPGGWRFEPRLGYVTGPSGVTVRLSPSEAALLQAFTDRPGEVLRRDDLMSLMYEAPSAVNLRSIDARVARLRRRLQACEGAGDLIKTLRRNGGYAFHVTARPAEPPQAAAA